MTLLSWMLRAMLISAFLGIAALAGERALRAVRWQTRWSWTIALLLLAVWPPISTLLARARLPVSVTALLSASPAVAHAMSANPALSPRLGQSIAILWVLASVLLALRLAHALRAIAALRARSRRAIIDGSSVLLSDAAGPATIGIRSGCRRSQPRSWVRRWPCSRSADRRPHLCRPRCPSLDRSCLPA